MNNEHILNLIKGQNYMNCNILATSRPHNIVDVEEYFDVVVEGQGFNKRVFHMRTEMPIVAFSSLPCENKKIPVTKCYPQWE